MVSGAIGGFLDVAFNFNTQALLDDNLIGQLVIPVKVRPVIMFALYVTVMLTFISCKLRAI